MSPTQEQVQGYRDNGYLVIPKLFGISEIDRIRALIYRLYQKLEPCDGSLEDCETPWNDARFDARLIALRASKPQVFGALYDCAQSSLELIRLVTDPRAAAAEALGEATENLSYSGIMLRMDCPQDKRNVLNWHQDRAYYPQNFDGNNGLVLTVALQDIRPQNGPVALCPKSHKEGLVEPEQTDKADYVTTEQRAVPMDRVAQYREIDATMDKGDALLINMNLFHRSGANVGDTIRFSALCRFHRITADDYVPFGLHYEFNEFMMARVTGDGT